MTATVQVQLMDMDSLSPGPLLEQNDGEFIYSTEVWFEVFAQVDLIQGSGEPTKLRIWAEDGQLLTEVPIGQYGVQMGYSF
jgi:hypothetical protein